ncbi:hypothetical protein VZQ01_05725 [Myxococcus faecalis]|jgi:hypothetical protein|uniref:hypothetical protein n=1 Tax=Myxococcus TaxID=32 RepID=UPI001142834E|nr:MULTISPECIES: hypothetical protein [Myxococcus]MBZ4400706.1 hypothetical protein [Myxococcus sp. AS-1-15]MBZ4413932.1 hypothetical protein [Myxococcus sp. XM-1-1-1]MCK8500944.1 hypothetical protein [Myxococcus fulvus]BDT33020.1 DUF4280 domain-containing protein [Myxococcus sp. MH1]
MGAFVVHVGATVMCPHGGQVQTMPGNPRVKVGGQFVATMADQYLVTGCTFPPQSGGPCVQVKWMVPSVRVRVGGQFVILQNSVGMSLGAAPLGPPQVVMTQVRVRGT